MTKKVLYWVALFLMTFCLVTNAQSRKVSGTITDKADGTLLPGVNITIKGTADGITSDGDGKYQLEVSEGAVLLFSFIGYANIEVAVNGKDILDVMLSSEALGLDEVVVTALGIKRSKKALGYAVQDVKSKDLTQSGDANIVSALQGKIAGVEINQSAGGVGGSSRISIRGTSSLGGNDSPLWVIDGVPFDDGNGSDGTIWGGTSKAGAAFDINPDDIESISVLKGPNAAALYGSRAGNGVLVITTKKGSRNKSLGIKYAGSMTFSEIAHLAEYQDEYGQGSHGKYNKNQTSAWGPRMSSQQLESWTGETIPFEYQKDRLRDFTQTGIVQKHNISFNGGNDKGSFRVSLGNDQMSGIYKDHKVEKSNFDFRADYDINKWLNLDSKISYFRTKGNQRPEIGNYSYMAYLNTMPGNIRTQDLDPGYDILKGKHVETLYTTANANYRNPYFLQAQTVNEDTRERMFGYIAANVTITKELKLKLKYGLDSYHSDGTNGYLFADNVDANRPVYNTNQSFFREANAEFLLSYNKKFGDFQVGANIGGNNMNRYSETLSSRSGRIPNETDYFLGMGTNITSNERISEQEVRSIYGFTQIGYKDMLFIDLTARNDWSSTLTSATGDFDNSYFYPSVSLSGIISEMVELPSFISFMKVRGSWAQVGKATDPYKTDMLYSVKSGNYKLLTSNVPSVLVTDVKPEISSSFEVGADLRLFNNRVGFDFTFYKEETENQIISVPMAQSTGYAHKLINAGLITNQGFEFMLSTTPIKTKDFKLDVNFNFATNEGVMNKLDDEVKIYKIQGSESVVAIEGEKFGDIRGYTYRRDSQGRVLVDAQGLPMRSEKMSVIGNLQADWTGSLSLNANYKGFYVSTLFSIKKGGDIISSTEQSAVSAGTATRTTRNNRMDFFVDGYTEDGETSKKIVSAQEYWTKVSSITEEFIYDASFIKLKELAVGYNLPKNILNKIPGKPLSSVRVAFVARNLFYLYSNTPGTPPDAGAYSSGYIAQAYDFSPVPSTRTFGFSLNVSF